MTGMSSLIQTCAHSLNPSPDHRRAPNMGAFPSHEGQTLLLPACLDPPSTYHWTPELPSFIPTASYFCLRWQTSFRKGKQYQSYTSHRPRVLELFPPSDTTSLTQAAHISSNPAHLWFRKPELHKAGCCTSVRWARSVSEAETQTNLKAKRALEDL